MLKIKTKIGLVLILIGTIMFIFVMSSYLITHFFGYSLNYLLIVSTGIFYCGLCLTYEERSQRGRGIMLNIIGIVLIGIATFIIFLIDVWMDSLITLIVISAILSFLILGVPGLYKTIKQDNFPDLYKILDACVCIITSVLLILTILIAAIYKQNFSEHYFPNLGLIILVSILIPSIIAIIIYVYFKVFRFP